MAEAGADVFVPHMGLTTGGAIGAETAKTFDDCVPLIQAMHDAAKEVNQDVIVLCHGGLIAEPDDAAAVLAHTEGVVGFFGASSMERLPTETAMTDNMRRFKAIPRLERSEMSLFVMSDQVETTTFDWELRACGGAPNVTGCDTYVVMDVEPPPGSPTRSTSTPTRTR